MSMRVLAILHALLFLFALPLQQALAQEARSVILTEDADYFGFDLRTERDVSLESCQSICLADGQCRAFTYNGSAQWCFLKSDFSVLNSFPGAVAGRVVDLSAEDDLGAPPELSYLPEFMRAGARGYREKVAQTEPQAGLGFVHFTSSGDNSLASGNAVAAVAEYVSALAIAPEDVGAWLDLAEANFAVDSDKNSEKRRFSRDGGYAAVNAYLLSRGATPRAHALALIAEALDRSDDYRQALQAYEDSLALINDAEVRAAYTDLKLRKGFRILNHSVDTEVATPRACVQFSEDLVKTGIDYSSFVTVDGAPPRAIDAAERQLCVEGLEHGKQYRIVVRQGLPAAIGEVLPVPTTLSIYVRDRQPSVRVTGNGFVLPGGGRHGIPLVSVNTDSVEIAIYRIGDRALARLLTGYQFLDRLGEYDLSGVRDDTGQEIWRGAVEVDNVLNEEIVTSFPVDQALPDRRPGVYILSALAEGETPDGWQDRATQWFVVSDIGLSTFAGEDGLTVFARSLATAEPIEGAELQLLARNNEVLGEAVTDAEGRATFSPGLVRGEGGLVPAVLSAARGGDDFVFLDMTRPGFDLSDRGVAGRAAPGAIDVYAWTERGIYRAGETVHAAALARDDRTDAIANLPLTFIFTRPDGVEERRMVSDGAALGGHHIALDLEQTALRGAWGLAIHADPEAPALARVNFLVEDFVPDRIEFDLASTASDVAPGEPASLQVDGRYLYGAPAAGLELEGEINITTTREWERFPDYRFGLADEDYVAGNTIPLDDLPVADADGHADFDAVVDTLPSTTRLINAEVVVRMRESGGRAVERRLDLTVKPEATVIGIRPGFDGNAVPENGNATFRAIAVSPEGEQVAFDDALWTLVEIERSYQWYRTDSGWDYEPITVERKVSEGEIDLAAADGAVLSLPVGWGRYRLTVESADPTGPVASFEFDAGWYVASASTETPDGLEIALDKESYRAGDVARLQVSPRDAGELLVIVGAERLLATVTASVPAEGGEIEIPVGEDWGAGTYVTATLFRPGNGRDGRMPSRSVGVSWMSIDPGDRRLEVDLGTTGRSDPRAPLSIPVEVTGLAQGETGYVMVAAVDVGILNLTSYSPPDPEEWYFGQRRLGLEIRDLYGRLIDGSLGATGRLRTGGDGVGMAITGSPPTEKLVAFFSGPVELDEDGKALVTFDIPEFNGTARVMAVAWSKEAVGRADADVVIRDPVVVTAGQPRFLAAGDSSTIRLDIANTDGPAGEYRLTTQMQGSAGLKIGATADAVTLAEGGNATVLLPVSAEATGDATVTVALAHEDGTRVERTLFLPVRPASMPVTTQRVVTLAPEGGSIRVDGELLAASLLDGASVSVGVSPVSAFDVPSLLMTLDRYPYGCSEQTISRALPLLYVSELSAAAGMEDNADLRRRVQDAIDRVLTFQSSTGSFGMWGPGWGDLWLDAYVTEFLSRAHEQGYRIPAMAMKMALDNVRNSIAYDQDVAGRGSEIAYALYVLARNKEASVGDLRYYADTRLDEFESPMARAQIAASLALYGDAPRAERAFASALRQAQGRLDDTHYRTDYGSNLRDGAAMLALAAETTPSPSAMPAMVRLVEENWQAARNTSTQEQVWMVLAARALEEAGSSIRLDINGEAHTGTYATRLAGEEVMSSPLTLVNRGSEPVDAVITTVATPAEPLAAMNDGFEISRSYYTLDGEPASISQVEQNERFVVVLRIDRFDDWPARIAVTDLLPAGLEIDNPRLVGSAELSNFGWLGQPQAAHTEFRDDRFVAAFDRQQGQRGNFRVAYVVRAVTPGVYVHPAAVVEDMYRPQYSARTPDSMMEVVAAN